MAASAATLAFFVPKDAELFGQAVSVTKYNGVPALKFLKEYGASSPVPYCFFAGILLRTATSGFSSTTGIQVKIHWSAPHGQVSGAARWAVAWDLKGQTDKPTANADGTPAYGSTYEDAANTTTNSTAGGLNVTSISCTIAHIQAALTTAPAIGDFFRLRLRRAVENAGDTISDEVYVHAVELVDY